jgi:hypothetical protein
MPSVGNLSASGGTFGIRAGFAASGVAVAPSLTTATLAPAAPTVGVSLWLGRVATLLLDVGLGFGATSSAAALALGTQLGVDLHFGNALTAFRPLVSLGAGFTFLSTPSADTIGLSFSVGTGAEYFFSPNFSMIGRIQIVLPLGFPTGNVTLGIFTLTPGIAAAWYF